MKKIESILAATDFSDDAGHAIARAAMVASEQRAGLGLLHVISEPSLSAVKSLLNGAGDIEACLVADAHESLQREAAGILEKRGLHASARVAVGAVVDTIHAAGSRADLTVVGGHGVNPLRDLVLGSTAERVLGRCTTPVLVVKRAPQVPYRHVLLAVDLSELSAAALDLAMRLAPRAGITILHAYSVPFESKLSRAGVSPDIVDQYRAEAALAAREQIDSLILTSAKDRTGLVSAVAHGNAPYLILKKQEELDADLIVMGCREQSALALYFLGSVSRHVLADASCDVLVIPGKAATQGDGPS
ncbi:MAG: universal stress protein [Burkholderiales bacterium]